jgi:GNAT superfamily N-acetyltransferase
MCERDGRVAGMMSWSQPDFDRSGRVWVSLCVHPDHCEDGTADELIAETLRRVEPTGADALWFVVREDFRLAFPDPASLGFREVHRTFGGGFFLGTLNLNSAKLESGEAPVNAEGVTLQPWEELAALPGHDQAFQALYSAIVTDKHTAAPTITAGATEYLGDEDTLWEASFIATRKGEYIGVAIPERSGLGSWNAVLGVRRDWRKRGIGSALQSRVLHKLAADGFDFLNAAGVKTDVAYLSLLQRLGANIEPDWVSYERKLG